MAKPVSILSICMMLAMFFTGPVFAIQTPDDLVAKTTDQITSTLRAEQDKIKANPVRLYEIVDEVVLPHFDFERMSRWALGKYWRKAKKK
jgi:phospholipid transport system substrate-binding protein